MPALQYFLDKGGQFGSAFGAVLHKLSFILLHQLLCLGGEHGFSLLLKVSGRLKFDNPKDRLRFQTTFSIRYLTSAGRLKPQQNGQIFPKCWV